MAQVSIRVEGLGEVLKHLNRVAHLNDEVKSAVTQATGITEATAKDLCPVDTGNLCSTIRMDVRAEREEIIGRVFTACEYAMYVEFGTGIIGELSNHPRAKKLGLSYANYPWTYTPDGGKTFYRTRGYVARPFMYRALKWNEANIKRIIISAVERSVMNV